MTMPNPVGSGMPDYSGSVPGNPGTVPAYPGTVPAYPGIVPGNPYADMQPAPEFAAPPSKALGVTSMCLGVIGLLICVGGLFFGAYISFDAHDSYERAMAPLAFIFGAIMIYIPGAIMNIVGLILGVTGRKRVQDSRRDTVSKVGIWMNAIPMILFLAAVTLTFLFAMAS